MLNIRHIGVISTDDPNALLLSTSFWTGGESGTAVGNVKFDEMWEADGSPYFYVYRQNNSKPDNVAPAQPATPKPDAVDQVLNVGDYFKARPAYRVDEFEYINGVEQVVNYELAGGRDFNWVNNGLGIASVDKVDQNGNITSDQRIDVGDYFRLHSDRIKVVDVDPSTNGVAFGTRYGNIWASASTLTEVK